MSTTKAALKAAKAALDAKKYQDAIDQAKTVLKTDPNNYHAYTFAPIAPAISAVRLTLPPLGMYSWVERSKSWIRMKTPKKLTNLPLA